MEALVRISVSIFMWCCTACALKLGYYEHIYNGCSSLLWWQTACTSWHVSICQLPERFWGNGPILLFPE